MKLKLIDYKTDCGFVEIYDGRMWASKPVLTFEMENGTKKDVKGYRFHHGLDNSIRLNTIIPRRNLNENAIVK